LQGAFRRVPARCQNLQLPPNVFVRI
jgi:hypothetical protein